MPPKHLTLAILLLAFTAHSGESTITYANKTYKTAKIGTQTWMAENLNYETEGSVCYENNPANCAKYGRLYNWETAMKVCPKGWHLPSNAEWEKLFRYIDGDTGFGNPYESPSAGKHLKAASGWNEDGNGTDDYGFSALPGGGCNPSGDFDFIGYFGSWWSTTEKNANGAYSCGILFIGRYTNMNYSNKSSLFSVRCVQD